jgi:hypothetical protein
VLGPPDDEERGEEAKPQKTAEAIATLTHRKEDVMTTTRVFPLGQLVITPGALGALVMAGQSPDALLDRHAAGDWGDLCDADRQENAYALRTGLRLLSAYTLTSGQRLWILTEADRSATTLLLPEEY